MEEKICRICHDDKGPFIDPCACTGTQRYVHYRCLIKWVGMRKKLLPKWKCDVCLGEYFWEGREKWAKRMRKIENKKPPEYEYVMRQWGLEERITRLVTAALLIYIYNQDDNPAFWWVCLIIGYVPSGILNLGRAQFCFMTFPLWYFQNPEGMCNTSRACYFDEDFFLEMTANIGISLLVLTCLGLCDQGVKVEKKRKEWTVDQLLHM